MNCLGVSIQDLQIRGPGVVEFTILTRMDIENEIDFPREVVAYFIDGKLCSRESFNTRRHIEKKHFEVEENVNYINEHLEIVNSNQVNDNKKIKILEQALHSSFFANSESQEQVIVDNTMDLTGNLKESQSFIT